MNWHDIPNYDSWKLQNPPRYDGGHDMDYEGYYGTPLEDDGDDSWVDEEDDEEDFYDWAEDEDDYIDEEDDDSWIVDDEEDQ